MVRKAKKIKKKGKKSHKCLEFKVMIIPLEKNNLFREERLFFFFLSLVETLKHDCDFY